MTGDFIQCKEWNNLNGLIDKKITVYVCYNTVRIIGCKSGIDKFRNRDTSYR